MAWPLTSGDLGCMAMAEIVLRARIIGGEHLDVTYEEDGGTPERLWTRSSRPSRKTTAYCAAGTAAGS
jgi:hypothetical protein